jgi:hypothetical protein
MPRQDRQARLDRAKQLGRIAYRHARDGTIVGYVEIERGRFFIRELQLGPLSVTLYAAANFAPSDEDLSELRFWSTAIWSRTMVRTIWSTTRLLRSRRSNSHALCVKHTPNSSVGAIPSR